MKKHTIYSLYLFCILLCSCLTLQAQKISAGKDFWVTFGPNASYVVSNESLQIRLIAIKACQVTFTYTTPGITGQTYNMNAGEVRTVTTDSHIYHSVDNSGKSTKTLKITSTEDIYVYALNQKQATTEATAVFPVSTYGTEYHHFSHGNFRSTSNFRDGILVIANENGTQVRQDNKLVGTLNAGEVFYIKGVNKADMTGRYIWASKPVAAFSVNSSAGIVAGGSDCLFEQLVSVDKWGKAFQVPVTILAEEKVRIITSESPTEVTIQYQTGSKQTIYLNKGMYREITTTSSSRGAYITANRPIAVCTYMIGKSNGGGDPSLAWVPALEQMVTDTVSIAPFQPIGETALTTHYAQLVVKTEYKHLTRSYNSATNSWTDVSGGWVDHRSGYSYLNQIIATNNNTSLYYRYWNPTGLLMWGYGRGLFESYHYLTSATFKRLDCQMYINNISYEDFEGKRLNTCKGLQIKGEVTVPVNTSQSYITWYINNIQQNLPQNTLNWTTAALSPGIHTIRMVVKNSSGKNLTTECNVIVTDQDFIWTGLAGDSNWNNPGNWRLTDGNTSMSVPEACHKVYIPGTAGSYPDLETTILQAGEIKEDPVCDEITFHFGGEVAKPHRLTYNKAFIRYNFGYYNGSSYQTDGDAYSAIPMLRNRWYALAAPLKKIASGDFSLGGYPFTYQMGFESSSGTTGDSGELQGSWILNNTTAGYEIGGAYNYAISVLVEPYEANVLGKGDHKNLNGLQGIFEFPYFENTAVSALHRIHEYDATNKFSSFKYFYHKEDGFPFSDTRDPDILYRGDDGYRFIFENANNIPVNPFQMQVSGSEESMVGNPFLSSLDFDVLYAGNNSNIREIYKLYVNHQFVTYDVNVGTTPLIDKYIAPLQAFFITPATGAGATINLSFQADNVSVTRPPGSDLQLKNTTSPYRKDVLFLLAESEGEKSMVTFALNKEQGESSKKMFIYHEENLLVPQMYVLDTDGKTKNEIQYVYGSDITLPVGIKCEPELQVTLKAINTEQLSARHLVLYDRKLKKETNLLTKGEYSFVHDPGFEERFELHIAGMPSSIEEQENMASFPFRVSYANNNLTVQASFPMEDVTIYTIHGDKLFQKQIMPASQFSQEIILFPGIYICEITFAGSLKQQRKFPVRIVQ